MEGLHEEESRGLPSPCLCECLCTLFLSAPAFRPSESSRSSSTAAIVRLRPAMHQQAVENTRKKRKTHQSDFFSGCRKGLQNPFPRQVPGLAKPPFYMGGRHYKMSRNGQKPGVNSLFPPVRAAEKRLTWEDLSPSSDFCGRGTPSAGFPLLAQKQHLCVNVLG